MLYHRSLLLSLLIFISGWAFAQQADTPREHIRMDQGWRFALGHPYNPAKDFYNGTSSFSYLSKTGYGDGAASPQFDDRSWRKVNLPHDWAVEQPFDSRGSASHGFKAIGRNFPEASVGWYRKTFIIPQSDLGRHISITFDGVGRNSIVWVNGHYLGIEPSGYNSFEYDIAEYLNYGGENVIAVRADVTIEEGWFYEGAGIYRHVWLNKTDQLHIATNGTFVTTKVNGSSAIITTTVNIINTDKKARTFNIIQKIVNFDGKIIATSTTKDVTLNSFVSHDFQNELMVNNPKLWSLENPYLHQLITIVQENGSVTDEYKTTFGIRTLRFDANQGFFLNGKHVEIKGTNNHQDHAGVGTALPDALQDFRITTLKSMGSNAYRCSHNPATPELLDACDRLGMLVIDENRQMGVSSTQLNDLKRMIIRDRNHPSIISWSIGNEEWGIEGSITGTRIAATMQAYVKSVDSTRFITAAISGGIGYGISNSIDVLGYNYIANKNTDEQHKKQPNQLAWGTEEGSTVATRGIYHDDLDKHYLAAYDKRQNEYFVSLEDGWKYYAKRPFLAGMFIWTGFDYRGEPTPFGWPSTVSLFGMVDACGFPKDDYYYLQSWWGTKPILHILPHWNFKGKEGKTIDVWTYSNCDEVELFLNKKSLGKKRMEQNGHLSWMVPYQPGMLEATGYKRGVKTITDMVKTTGDAETIQLTANKTVVEANERDIAILTIATADKNKLWVPTANNPITFSIQGPGKIIGVGNGDPTSLEADQYHERIATVRIGDLKEKLVDGLDDNKEIRAEYDDSQWQKAFKDTRDEAFEKKVKAVIYRGNFIMPGDMASANINLFYNSLGKGQTLYINGKEIGRDIKENKKGDEFKLDVSVLHPGKNTIAVVTTPLIRINRWAAVNMDPGLIQLIYPAEKYNRKLFNGLAQVIVQAGNAPGEITVTATSAGLKQGEIKIQAKK